MPKERTHWLLARRASANLPTGLLADAVLAYGEFALAGAVAHDSGYYAAALGHSAGQHTADRLHGNSGWDTFTPFRALSSRRDLGAPALAFGFGALTHLAADAVFHPLVYSWTGDAGADAPWNTGWLYRHQALETALDRHAEALWGPAPVRTFAKLVGQAGRELVAIQSVFSGNDARRWIAAHARVQALFTVKPLLWLVQLVRWASRAKGDSTGVFYRGGPKLHASFEGTLTWTDPVTGRNDQATLDELVSRFDALIAGLASEWEAVWASGRKPFASFGPHLDTGVPSDLPQAKRYFAGTPWSVRTRR